MPRASLLCLPLASLLVAGCHVVGQNDHNLSQLHDADSRHRYTAVLVEDYDYVLRTAFGKSLTETDLSLESAKPGRVDNPTLECTANLVDLMDFERPDDATFDLQVEWVCRLAAEDPAAAVRTRACEFLGQIGARLGAGLPQAVGAGADSATPEQVSQAAAQVLAAVRAARDGAADAAPKRQEALTALRALRMDGAGLWRATRLVRELRRIDAGADLAQLHKELQVQLWKRSAGRAILDTDERVRAAAWRAVAECDPKAANQVVWELLRREGSDHVRAEMCRMLRERGLPADGDGVKQSQWLEWLYQLAVGDDEDALRCAAMLALSERSGAGLRSLREEDWQAWWLARK